MSSLSLVVCFLLFGKFCKADYSLLNELVEHHKIAKGLGRTDNVFSGITPSDGFEIDLVPITIAINFDTRPNDIRYQVMSVDGQVIYAQETPGSFTIQDFDQKLYTKTIELKRGQSYLLQIEDAEGNGLQASWSFYAVYFGSETEEEILREDQFHTGMHEVVFVASRMVTRAPTSSPQPSTSPAPTHAPTTCLEETLELYDAEDTSKDWRPHFKTGETTFPSTNKYCAPHRTYAHCTNEKREDCQWQFLGASGRQGVCRVDPISKCIRNGNCVCNTIDFKGGGANMGKGILMHVPVSVTSQDIGPYRDLLTHYEIYKSPGVKNDAHPQDEDFYISRVDFTGRKLVYDFDNASPVVDAGRDLTFAFKLHYLYSDLPMVGLIFKGLGLRVHLDTSASSQSISINGVSYQLRRSVKKWTCSSIVITQTSIFVAGHEIFRSKMEKEESGKVSLELGRFSGELFDFRIYRGTLKWREIREFGARCAVPEDPAALQY